MQSKKRKNWLMAADVMRMLGISNRSKLRRMQRRGEIEYELNRDGHAIFARAQVEELAAKRGIILRSGSVVPAAIAAKAFELFGHGKTWQEVVVILALDPRTLQPIKVVRALHDEFLDRPSGVDLRKAARSTTEPETEDDDDERMDVDDVETWQREQASRAALAQAELERDQREWEEEQRKRAAKTAGLLPAPTKSPVPMESDEKSEAMADIALLIELLLGKKS